MARRSLHLTISALVLLALLLSARLSPPAAQASPLAGGLSVGINTLYGRSVVADINEPIKLAALATEDPLPGNEHIVIGDWNGKGFSDRLASCDATEATCTAIDPGGEAGTVKIKAAVIGPHKKILAKSSTVKIVRTSLSLTLEITGPDGKPDSGTELAGTLVTMHVPEQPFEGSSWSKIVFAARVGGQSGAWQEFGSPCTLPCDQPTTGGTPGSPQEVDYEMQAVDPNGKVVKESNVVSITYRPWTIDLRVNGAPISGDTATVNRHQPAKISASVNDSLTIGAKTSTTQEQQFHLIIVDNSPTNGPPDVADCITSPCEYTANPPGPDCTADCTHSYTALVQNGRYNDGNNDLGKQPITITFQGVSGYQFSGLTFDYTWNRTTKQCEPGTKQADGTVCMWDWNVAVHADVSGYICGDPYKDPWTISSKLTSNFGTSTGTVTLGDDNLTFDPMTELVSDQKSVANLVAPAPEHILEQYINLSLHGMADPDTGVKTPDKVELSAVAPSDVTNPHQIPVPGESYMEWVKADLPSGSSTAMVTVKGDCP